MLSCLLIMTSVATQYLCMKLHSIYCIELLLKYRKKLMKYSYFHTFFLLLRFPEVHRVTNLNGAHMAPGP